MARLTSGDYTQVRRLTFLNEQSILIVQVKPDYVSLFYLEMLSKFFWNGDCSCLGNSGCALDTQESHTHATRQSVLITVRDFTKFSGNTNIRKGMKLAKNAKVFKTLTCYNPDCETRIRSIAA